MKKFIASLLTILSLGFAGCTSTSDHETAGEYIDNSGITMRVKAALVDDPDVKSRNISVKSYKGVVLLSGFVDSQLQIDRAIRLTKKVPGVHQVRNSLIIKSPDISQPKQHA